MLSDEFAICVENLGKCYHIYDRSQDRLKQSIVPRFRRLLGQPAPNYYREFWALRNVSFELRRGETLGIIGRNGSGKSTLLQIICGTLTPTTGNVATSGRVAALLELGAGFNPEFTGHENVYLNGSVLGLTRAEIDEKFDAIAAFADIGDFIEQPVKTYSSGMFIRLAFAVIAHVDADVLVVDEALAVGDAIFIQKCMRFIRRFQEQGALLFVSHDTSAVINLCKKAIWLNHGLVRQSGSAKTISEAYQQYTLQKVYGDAVHLQPSKTDSHKRPEQHEVIVTDEPVSIQHRIDMDSEALVVNNLTESDGWNTNTAEILSVVVEKMDTTPGTVLHGGDRVKLIISAVANQSLDGPVLGFSLNDRLGQSLFGDNTQDYIDSPISVLAGEKLIATFIFKLPLLPTGQYTVTVALADGTKDNHVHHQRIHDALLINVMTSKQWAGLVGIPFEKVTLETCIGD